MPGVIVVGATSGNGLEVDVDHHALVNVRAPAFGALGYYRMAAVSGATVSLAANAAVFSFRWSDATHLCLVQSIKVGAVEATSVTAGVVFDLACFVARSFSASDTGGTALTPSTNNQKMRTSMGTTLLGDARISTTGALAAGTRTLDAQPIGRVQGFIPTTTVGGQVFPAPNPAPLYVRDNADHHPLVLATNEGFVITAPLAGNTTGSVAILVQVEWGEVSTY
jgi:hypothetical protein